MELTRRQQVIDAGITGKPWHEIAHELGISRRWAEKCFARHADDRARLKRAAAARRRPAQKRAQTPAGPAVPRPIQPEPALPRDYFANDPRADADHGSAWMPSKSVVGSCCSASAGWLL